MFPTLRRAATTALFFAVAACGGGDGGTNPPVSVGGFSVSLSTSTLTVQQGNSESIVASIARTGSFSGTVNLSTENMPAGITASFSPAAITAGTTTTSLSVTVAASVAPGAYTFVIRGQAAGLSDQTATVNMTVTARPSIALALTPASGTIPQGGTGNFVARVTRTAVSGFATLSTTGAPSGVTITHGQVGDSALYLIQVGDAAPLGTHSITVTASVAGASPASATFSLTITAAPLRITLSPSTVRIAPGTTAQVAVSLIRNNFAAPVTLSVPGPPGGMTITFDPSPTTGNTATMTIAVAANTGSSNGGLTILATAPGITAVSASMSYDIRPAPTGSIALAVSPDPVTVLIGGPEVYTDVTVTRTNYSGQVNLIATGGPTGFLAEFETNPVLANSSRIVLTAPPGTAAGSYVLTLTGGGPGIDFVSVPFTVNVVEPAGSVAITATPNALTATAGGPAVTSTIAITRTNYTGDITFAAAGMPTGSQSGFSPSPTTGNSATATFSFTNTVPLGTYPVTITASGTNIVPVQIQVMITVVQAAAGSIALSVTQNPVSVQQGNSGNTTVNIARTNFAAPVNLAVTGVPANVTATLGSTSTAGNSTTLTLAAAANAPVGSHTITITGTGTGITAATTTVTLQINAASGGTSVTAQFCGTASADIPIWFAAQDGNGAWSRITAGTNNTYTFTINSATGAVAYVKQEATDDFTLTLIHGARAELIISDLCGAPPVGSTKMVTGTLAGVGATDVVSVQFGGATAAPTMLNPNFSLNNVRDGLQDILATRAVLNLTPPIGFFVNKLFLKRNLNPANGGSIGTVDFNGSDAFDPDQKTATLSGVGVGESTSVATFFATANSAATVLGLPLTGSSTTVNYIGVPAARVIAGDFHMFTASAQTFTGSTITAFRTSTAVEQNASNLTLSFGAVLPQPTVTSTNGGYARIRTVVGRPSDYDLFWTMVHDQSAANRRVNISLLPGYFSSLATLDVSVPDFSGVAGWQDTWGPRPGAATSWTIHGAGSTVGNGQPIIGARSRTAQRNGSFTP